MSMKRILAQPDEQANRCHGSRSPISRYMALTAGLLSGQAVEERTAARVAALQADMNKVTGSTPVTHCMPPPAFLSSQTAERSTVFTTLPMAIGR